MASTAAEPTVTATGDSPFLRGRLILSPSTPTEEDFGNVLVHISGDVRCIRASSNPQRADDFANSDVVIELQRAEETGDSSDDDTPPDIEAQSFEALVDSVLDVIAPRPEHDNCTLSIIGKIAVRECAHTGCSQGQGNPTAHIRAAWLVAGSREERDIWLLLLRARMAPARIWYCVCRGHALKCESWSSARLKSFCQDRSSPASEREIAGVLHGERSRWMRDNVNTFEEIDWSYGAGSEDDASDATLLLFASVMQMLALSQRARAAATREEFRGRHACATALQSINTYGKRISEAMYAVLSAAATIERDSSTGEVIAAVIGCWEILFDVEAALRKTAAQGVVSDATQRSLQDSEKKVQDFALSASYSQQRVVLQQRVLVQNDVGSTQPTNSRLDGPYVPSFRVDIAYSLAVAIDGSPKYDRIVDELLNTDATDDIQPVAVTSVSGEGGAGKTTTCVLALRDARVRAKYTDGVFGFEIGFDAKEHDLIDRVASVVEGCQGFKTAHDIREMTELSKAAAKAAKFFHNRQILLYLDNAWPDSKGLEDLMSIAGGRGSCVLFSTRSTGLATDYTDHVVELGSLQLDVAREKTAAEMIFYKHLGTARDHGWCTAANVNEALSLSQGLPIAIATLAALVRNKLVRRVTTNVLEQVAGNLHSPPMSSSRNLRHKGLFAAMTESLVFLDRQRSTTGDNGGESRGLMTRRYASLHALDRSENRINASVLSIVWDTSLEDAEVTAGDFFSMGLVRLASPGAVSLEGDNKRSSSDTLTLHDLQVEYSERVANSGRYGITVAEVHETAVRGMFEGNVDIDALGVDGFISRCEELCQTSSAGEDRGGRYLVSNLMRHLVDSLNTHNAWRRWPTIRRLLSDARWLLMCQRVDGWASACNRYARLWDTLSANESVVKVIPEAEIEGVAELGRVGQLIQDAPRSWRGEDEEKKAAVEMYFRLYATWLERSAGLSRTVLQRTLCSLCAVAGQWWMRPMVACREPPVRDRRLRMAFVASPQPVRGCALIGSNGHIVTSSWDCVVRIHDSLGALVAQHDAHCNHVNSVCLGRNRGENGYHVLSVSLDGKLVRWDVLVPSNAPGSIHATTPVVLDSTNTQLEAVACSLDASVVAAGGTDGIVYLWAFFGSEGAGRSTTRIEGREHTGYVECVAVSSDGAKVLSGSWDGTCRLWGVMDASHGGAALSSKAVFEDYSAGWDRVLACAFACEDRVAVTAHSSGVVRFWSLMDTTLLGKVSLESGRGRSLAAIGPAGDEVVVGTDTGVSHVVRVRDRAVTAQLGRGDEDMVRSVYASPRNRHTIVCGHHSGQVKVWDADHVTVYGAAESGTDTSAQRQRHSSSVSTVSTSSCGRCVASGGFDGTVRCWRADTGQQRWKHDCGSGVNCVCVSADSAHVVSGCSDGTVCVIEMSSGAIVCLWKHECSVRSVCMHKLGDGLVWSGHATGEVAAWRHGRSEPAHRVQGLHEMRVVDLAVSAGGRYVYSRDSGGRTAQIETSENGDTIIRGTPRVTDQHGRRSAFPEHIAPRFRTGGHMRKHLRVRLVSENGEYDLTSKTLFNPILNVELQVPDRTQTTVLTAVFDYCIRCIDATFVAAADGDCSFAQVVCGLDDGSVCILRQPLADDARLWHPAQIGK